MLKKNKILLVVSLFYLVYILLFLARFNFNPSGAIEFSSENVHNLNGSLPSGVVLQENSSGFDGQLYYMVSLDLLHRHSNIDALRYHRIFYPFLSYIMSFGYVPFIPFMMLLISYISIIGSTYFIIKILEKYHYPINLAYLWALNIGFFISVIRDLGDPLMYLLIAAAVYFIEEERFGISVSLLCLAILTKETAVIIILPICLYYLLKKRIKISLIFSIPLFVYALWNYIVFLIFGRWPFFIGSGASSFGLPFIGAIKYFLNLKMANNLNELLHMGHNYATALMIFFVLFVMFQVLFFGDRKNSLYKTVLIFQIFFFLCLSPLLAQEKLIFNLDDQGRYCMGLFLSYILYLAERGKKISKIPVFLMLLMDLEYFLLKIIAFRPLFIIS